MARKLWLSCLSMQSAERIVRDHPTGLRISISRMFTDAYGLELEQWLLSPAMPATASLFDVRKYCEPPLAFIGNENISIEMLHIQTPKLHTGVRLVLYKPEAGNCTHVIQTVAQEEDEILLSLAAGDSCPKTIPNTIWNELSGPCLFLFTAMSTHDD